MKTAVVWSSPNTDGLTATAKDRIITGLKTCGVETDEIHLNKMDIKHCQACKNGWGNCQAIGKCVIEDDFSHIYERITAADAIVFVTAVYWHDMTEYMKALLDRIRRCDAVHNGFLKEKECLLAACAGGTGIDAVECLHSIEETIGYMGMKVCDRIPVNRYNKEYMLDTLEKAGETFARHISVSGGKE